ncbi:protein BREAKING OF ASYMMETRY IN THE STOMATAL LINEAGE isoform X2 [Brassica rapa]|uniref:protein BREAKING OF ASYMMETRY IN THE STOMATAL LINEAGE isoform X2 n=1 Tax=Brassica campestris TaxID=3711 RepID=UPI0004F1508E|nr:protein BREAKING OF ASYMMETRY IN THE STOMATAL LINEAGE isoform X2 [Brassica rapa]
MASQWTIQKLVTWRVKDWANCFLASKIPIDIDEDGVNNTGNTMSNNNVMFKRTKRKMKSKKKRSERKLSLSPPGTRHHHLRSSSVSPTLESQNRRLSWQQQAPASDEPGFIVFCFDREDGGFDVVKEGKEERKELELSSEKSPRTVNRKLIYGDQEEVRTEKVNSPEIKEKEQDQEAKTISPEIKDISCDVHDQKNEEEEEVDASDKSSGSSHSDERRGSFAFPVLGVEWMGSPVQMPKIDDLSPKKQKPIALGFQCCRF